MVITPSHELLTSQVCFDLSILFNAFLFGSLSLSLSLSFLFFNPLTLLYVYT